MLIREILQRAYDILKDRKNWTWGTNARDLQGNAVNPKDPYATCFCGTGVIEHVMPENGDVLLPIAALQRESEIMFGHPVQQINDLSLPSCDRDDSHRKVLAVYEAVLKRWEEQEPTVDDLLRGLFEKGTPDDYALEMRERLDKLHSRSW